MTRHRRVSCSPTRRAAAATGMALTRVMTKASNRRGKPEPGRAPGPRSLPALGPAKAPAGLEIDLDVEPLLLGVEIGVRHHPRRHQAECELEQIDITHGLSPLARFAAIVPPCSRPSRTSPHGRAIPRVLDRRSTWRRIERAAGAKGWLRRTEQKDGGKGAESPFPVLVSH